MIIQFLECPSIRISGLAFKVRTKKPAVPIVGYIQKSNSNFETLYNHRVAVAQKIAYRA